MIPTTFPLGISKYYKKINKHYFPDLPMGKVESKLLKATERARDLTKEQSGGSVVPLQYSATAPPLLMPIVTETTVKKATLLLTPPTSPFLWWLSTDHVQPTFRFWTTRPPGKACKDCLEHPSQPQAQDRPQC